MILIFQSLRVFFICSPLFASTLDDADVVAVAVAAKKN